ncbi:MAG: tRNA preQ1(34) S-adenosylmethionine ribosyltransferase-isomerase QueA [Oscillospiraceae bacterium]|nr:tRNA preQ1(34) S-adenosylmethionine ribosyltransferase-isomerase QueA [Oscillospiraceae bacterium]
MNKNLFDFYLPKELIAQTPIQNRDNSKMMILEKSSGKTYHNNFKCISDFLEKGDLLVLNDSKVLKARIFGYRKDTNHKIEFLFLREISENIWETLTKPGKKAKIGNIILFPNNTMSGEIIDILENGNRIISLSTQNNKTIFNILDEIGTIPLPIYIKDSLKDDSRYQTLYSKHLGSVAAPTAGLHFTEEVFDKLEKKGVNIAYITLHVGVGTFRPVKTVDIEDHQMHSEFYNISQETLNLIKLTKEKKKNIIAVGTTSCRTLETIGQNIDKANLNGSTNIFIYPGYEFKLVDGIITNFHLPESSLIMLVSAFAGHKNIMEAYKLAIENKYRFYSFGDCMLIK